MAFTPRCGTGRLKVMFIELAMRQSSINKLLRFKWFNDLLRFNVEGSCQITIMLWQFDRTSLPVCAAILDLPRFEWRYEAADQHFLANESTKSHTTNDKIASIGFCSDLGFDLAATIQKTGQVVICDDSGLHWSKTWPKKRSSQACLARQDRSWPQFLSRLGGAMQCIYIYIYAMYAKQHHKLPGLFQHETWQVQEGIQESTVSWKVAATLVSFYQTQSCSSFPTRTTCTQKATQESRCTCPFGGNAWNMSKHDQLTKSI